MATADNIRSGIKTNITSNLSGLEVFDRWRGNVTPPCVVMDYPRPVEQLGVGAWRWDVRVQLQIRLSDVEQADRTIAPYVDTSGSDSMIAAIHSDKTLGGTVSSVRVVGVSDIGPADHGEPNASVMAVTWDVEVYA